MVLAFVVWLIMDNTELEWRYDVYLSFRGDTRHNFTGHLYNALRQKRIKTFMNDEGMQSGDQISPFLLKAIEQSRISIVVFSQQYVDCTWCLEELVKIVECMKTKNQLVLPIFYKVTAHVVRNQIKRYGHAMARYEKKFQEDPNKVQKWRSALSEVANLVRLPSKGYEYEYIERIVKWVSQSLPRYNIFLNFRGKDTRHSFTGFLYHALCREGFKTFMDEEELADGEQISKSLIEAIETSKLSIVVLSENYACSSWCLDELVKILECMKTKNQLVWPIFYKVEPSDVRYQKNSYEKAMATHEEKYGKNDKVLKWRSALFEVANLKGRRLEVGRYEYELAEEVVKEAVENDNENCTYIESPCSSTVE